MEHAAAESQMHTELTREHSSAGGTKPEGNMGTGPQEGHGRSWSMGESYSTDPWGHREIHSPNLSVAWEQASFAKKGWF